MNTPTKILLSARDPGAVGSILCLMNMFRQSPRFDTILVASGAAASLLKQYGENPIYFELPDQTDHLNPLTDNPDVLLEKAQSLLNSHRPDTVITSLSSFGVGIDEALLATSKVPTFAFQDAWGDINLGLNIPADFYCVLDQFAVRLTERFGVKAIAVGSPKYASYEKLNIPQLRRDTHKAIDLKEEEYLLGWFGQSPDVPGHEDVYDSLIKALSLLDLKFRLVIREHPKFSHYRKQHIKIAQDNDIAIIDATGEKTTETWLAACDLIITPFSLCGLDHANLSAYSPAPIGSVLYLMVNQEIREFAESTSCGYAKFPIVDSGVGTYLTENNPKLIKTRIVSLLQDDQTEKYFKNSKLIISKFNFNQFCEIIFKELKPAQVL